MELEIGLPARDAHSSRFDARERERERGDASKIVAPLVVRKQFVRNGRRKKGAISRKIIALYLR